MTNLEGEELLTLKQAAQAFPGQKGSKKLHRVTVGRWIARGIVRAGGGRLKLEAIRIGGSWITSREAIRRFQEALADGRTIEPVAATPAKKPKGTAPDVRQKLIDRHGLKLTPVE